MMVELSEIRRRRRGKAIVKLIKTEGKLAIREPIGIIFGLGVPILLLLIFGSVPAFNTPDSESGSTVFQLYVPVLIILVLIMIGVLGLPFPLSRNREIGWLRRISTTPVSPSGLLFAQVAINLIIGATAIVVLLVGSKVFFGITLSPNIVGFAASIILAIGSMFSLGLLIGSIAPTQGSASVLSNILLYPFLFLSGVYMPVPLLPGYLQTLSAFSPVGAAVKALGDSINGTFPSMFSLGVMIAYTLFFSFLAARYFRWE